MPKNYSEIYASVYTTGNSMSFGNTMLRGNGIPLDITEVYDSFDKAVIYAATNAVAYEGQMVAVTENGDTTVYVITPAKQGTHIVTTDDGSTTYDVYLKQVGSVPSGDDSSIEVVDEKIKIKNFGTSYYKYIPGDTVLSALYVDAAALTTDEAAVAAEDGTFAKVGATEEAAVWYKKSNGAWAAAGEDEEPKASSHELVDDGTFKAGLEPRVKVKEGSTDEYEIAWYEPATETVEGVSSKVQSVQQTVETVEKNVAAVETEVADLEDSIYGEGGTAEAPAEGSIAWDVNELDKIVGLSDATKGLTADVATLKTDLSTTQSELDALEKEVAKLPTVDTNTTYAFDNGTDGTFKYKSSEADDWSTVDTGAKKYTDDTLAAAKTELEGKITSEAGTREAADNALSGRISTLETTITGLEGAMHFIGVSTTDPLLDAGATVENVEEFASGDVVLFDGKEYIYDGSKWILFGDEGSYLTKTEAAGTYVKDSVYSVDKANLQDAIDAKVAQTAYDTKVEELEGKINAKAESTALDNYFTKTEAEAKFMDSTETDSAIDTKIAALDLDNKYDAKNAAKNAVDAHVAEKSHLTSEDVNGLITTGTKTLSNDVTALKNTVGDAEGGLVKDLADLAAQVNDIDYVDDQELEDELAIFKTTYVDPVDKKADDHINDNTIHHTKSRIFGYIDSKLSDYSTTSDVDTKISDAVKASENTLNAKINDKADTSALTELSNKVGTVEDTANSAIQEVRVDAATGLVAEADANDATVINIKFLEDVVFVMDGGTAGDIIAANSAE